MGFMIISSMSEIKLLSTEISNRIAAGEVVERPANAVKELIENAADAGADRIHVDIADGGIGLIRVIDNGKGILPEDLETSVQRFATSKVRAIEDVYRIESFGFRGEALAAISSVSDFSIKSIRKGHEASELVVPFSGEAHIKPASLSEGTIVTVKHLFDNVPARKKFLKTASTEQREILKMIRHFSLLNPQVGISLMADGKKTYESLASDTMLERAKRVFKESELIDVKNSYGPLALTAVVSLPMVQRFRKDQVIIGINGRIVKDQQLTYAVIQAYHRLMPDNRYPVAVIRLDLAPDSIDVNIHPSKMQIKLFHSKDVFNFVYDSIKKELQATPLNDTLGNTVTSLLAENNSRPMSVRESEPQYTYNMTESFETVTPAVSNDYPMEPVQQGMVEKNVFEEYVVIGQAFDTVIICQKAEDVFFIDQHIAHERVLFEKYKKNGLADIASIILVEAVLVECSDEDIYAALEHKDVLTSFGFEFEMFGSGAIKIVRVPTSILNKNIENEFSTIIAEIQHTRQRKEQDYAIVTMACKTAIKAGEQLSMFEMKKLVSDLFETENPFTCPHGRPIVFKMSKSDMFRKFQR